MAKKKTSSEVNHLRGVINQLKKDLKRKEKRAYMYEDLEAKEAEAALKEEIAEKIISSKGKCPSCGGKLEIIDSKKIDIVLCQDCDYRKSVVKK